MRHMLRGGMHGAGATRQELAAGAGTGIRAKAAAERLPGMRYELAIYQALDDSLQLQLGRGLASHGGCHNFFNLQRGERRWS